MKIHTNRPFDITLSVLPFFLAGIVTLANRAQAAPTFFGRPTKIMTCELLMNGIHQDYAVKETVLPVLRDVKIKLQQEFNQQKNDGVSFADTAYAGRINRMSPKTADSIIARLNGIEESLVGKNPDHQIFSVELRGEDLTKALETLDDQEKATAALYKTEINREWSRLGRYTGTAVTALLTWGNVLFASMAQDNISSGELTQILLGAVQYYILYAGIGDVAHSSFKYNKTKFDFDYYRLKEFLRAKSHSRDDIFISGNSLTLPTEFHKMLMAQNPKEFEEGRQQAIKQYGATFTVNMFNFLFTFSQQMNDKVKRFIKNAGDIERNVFLDHIVYFDEQANEPVWVFFYRSYRQKPPGRKPAKKVKEAKTELKWQPGLVPVPVKSQ